MSRKDIFYSGSVTNLKEYQSQKSLQDYRQSVVSLTKFERDHRDDPKYPQDVEAPPDVCPCLNLPPAFKNALSSMLDVTLLKDWAFMLIGVSNLFGMAALYIPFFFLIDASMEKVSWNCRLRHMIATNFISLNRVSPPSKPPRSCQLLESSTHSLVLSSEPSLICHKSTRCSSTIFVSSFARSQLP